MAETQTAAQSYGFRIALFYGALFVVYGMHVPFTPVWLDWRGLSAGEISTIMAAPFFLRLLVTPAVALAADRHGNHRQVLIVLAWASLLLVLVLTQAKSFWPILLLVVALVICFATIMPLTETIAVMGVRRAGLDYGRMRLWGSLTFIVASFCGGLIVQQAGAGIGIWLVALGCLLTLLAAHFLPHIVTEHDASGHAAPFWQAAEPRRLLSSPVFVAFLLAAGLAQAAHATLLTFGTLIWQHQGLSPAWSGSLWAIGVLAEVGLFAVSGPLIARFGAVNLLILAAFVSVLRWAAMAINPPLSLLVPLQLLHAMTYGGSHVAAIHFMHQAVPRSGSGSAQALYATVASGIAMGISTLIAGRLYASYGGGSYAGMAAISLLSLIAALRLRALWNGGALFEDIAVGQEA